MYGLGNHNFLRVIFRVGGLRNMGSVRRFCGSACLKNTERF